MPSRFRIVLLSVTLLALGGCSNFPTAPLPSPAALSSPQFTTIEVAQKAVVDQDWPAFLDCFVVKTDEVHCANYLRMVADSGGTPDVWLFEHYEKHGLSRDDIQTLRSARPGPEKEQALKLAEQKIADKSAFCEEMLRRFFKATKETPQGIFTGVPTQLNNVSDEMAILVLASLGPNKVARQQIVFMRLTDQGWKIDPSPRLDATSKNKAASSDTSATQIGRSR